MKNNLKYLNPVSLKEVMIKDGFWGDKIKMVQETVLPYQWEALNDRISEAVPSHAVENLRIAAGEKKDKFQGMYFQDSDLAKWLEAVAHSLASHPDPELEIKADEVISLIEKVQQEDGYFNTYFIIKEPEKRWTNLKDWHELYCAGHFIEAAVAYYEATGKKEFMDIMCRFADYIDSVFGKEKGKKLGYPGHEEIELALMKLYRVTNEKRYLELSKYFIDQRGQEPYYFLAEAKERSENISDESAYIKSFKYYQSHLPVRKQTTAEGHSVRAIYLYCGMADVSAETGDKELFNACKKLWDNVTEKRMYITGGIGSTHHGEAFTFDYDLPNDTAYVETCANIALVFWAYRMMQIDPDSRYADVMERALFNSVLSGISLEGTEYFYENPLEVWPVEVEKSSDNWHNKTTRQKWFDCACCPPNIARLLASLGQYIYSQNENEVYIHLYANSEVNVEIAGQNVVLSQKTNYPWQENIQITVSSEKKIEFTLAFRIPGWSREAKLKVNDEILNIDSITEKGYAKVKRVWKKGDKIELLFPMPVEKIQANPQVRMSAGKIAIQRGPVVYCLEECDNGNELWNISLSKDSKLKSQYDRKLLGGVVVITGEAIRNDWSSKENELYRPKEYNTKHVTIKAIPYFAWNNREPGEMMVWIRDCR